MIIKAAKFIQNWKVCYFLVKHPSQQTEQAQNMVSIVMLFDLERGRINALQSTNVGVKSVGQSSHLKEMHFQFLTTRMKHLTSHK